MKSIYSGLAEGIERGRRLRLAEQAAEREQDEASRRAEEANYRRGLRPLVERGLNMDLAGKEQRIAHEKAAEARAAAAEERTAEEANYKQKLRPMAERGLKATVEEKETGAKSKQTEYEKELEYLSLQKQAIKYLRQADFFESVADPDSSWPAIQQEYADVLKTASFSNVAANADGSIEFQVGDKSRCYTPEMLQAKADQLRKRAALTMNPAGVLKMDVNKGKEQAARQKALISQISQLERERADMMNIKPKNEADLAQTQIKIDELNDRIDVARGRLYRGAGLEPDRPTSELDEEKTASDIEREKQGHRHWYTLGFKTKDEEAIARQEANLKRHKERSKRVKGLIDAGADDEAPNTLQSFVAEFEAEYGRPPTENEIQRAREKGYFAD